jgi:hypothetical protein
MTLRLTHFLIALALLVGVAGGAQAAPSGGGGAPASATVAVAPASDRAAAERARTYAARTGARLRLPRTLAEQLGVLHVLAARGTPVVVGFGLDRRVAVEPVARRYPQTDIQAR